MNKLAVIACALAATLPLAGCIAVASPVIGRLQTDV
jgi:hypothetical protein